MQKHFKHTRSLFGRLVKYLLSIAFINIYFTSNAQLKFVIEDFEGLADGTSDLKANGIFTYGNIKANIDYQSSIQQTYAGERFLRLNKNASASGSSGKVYFGGWGKGISLNIELDPTLDYLNFYVHAPTLPSQGKTIGTTSYPGDAIKIELQEDDNENNIYENDKDDSWTYQQKIENKNTWQLVSIKLNKFKDSNSGGDGLFNVNYKQGKLLCFIVSFTDLSEQEEGISIGHGGAALKNHQTWLFDFVCFSQGILPTGTELFESKPASSNDLCSLGAWSKEGNSGNFIDIASTFENNFKYGSEKKLGVIHFFQPFSVEGSSNKKHYPSVEKINNIIQEGYIPMITLEDHFVSLSPAQAGANSKIEQPNLYSIIEGHFDDFFAEWALQIKQVKGKVLLRILHEFNGDWYPWCTVNNDKNPELVAKAFRHIHTIFKAQGVANVKFIWCPNSMSFPQEKWNFIMDAYPGDQYVDFVALDIYNGAGKEQAVWRSFRKEGIENYFILTQRLPLKPLLICETASRERKLTESKSSQDKTGWIKQMSEAITSDMSKIKLLAWFNEKESFKVSSSSGAQGAYLDFILKNDYFKSGTKHLRPLIAD